MVHLDNFTQCITRYCVHIFSTVTMVHTQNITAKLAMTTAVNENYIIKVNRL